MKDKLLTIKFEIKICIIVKGFVENKELSQKILIK